DLVADVAAGRCQRAQFIDLGLEFGDGFFKVEIAAHLIRHRDNIGNNVPGGEAVSIRLRKARIFNDLARVSVRITRLAESAPNKAARAGNGCFVGDAAEVKAAVAAKPISPPAGAGRAPGFSAAPRPHGYRSAWSRYRYGRAASARCAGPRRCAAGGWQRRGAVRAARPGAARGPMPPPVPSGRAQNAAASDGRSRRRRETAISSWARLSCSRA